MSREIQIRSLKNSVDWLFYQVCVIKKTYAAILGVSNVFKKTDALSEYGDYFAYTQNVMIGDMQLQLSKVFVENKSSHSLPKIINDSNKLFTEDYYTKRFINKEKSYAELKEELSQMRSTLTDLATPISNLRKVRNRDLAHFDKRISNHDSLAELIKSNPIYIEDAIRLMDFVYESLYKIKELFFNDSKKVREPDFTYELNKIADAITNSIAEE